MSQLITAYEQILQTAISEDALGPYDPFEEPEGPADRIFVNELRCLGVNCSYSCVKAMPDAFRFDEETQRARCTSRRFNDDEDLEYTLWQTVGQCPERCIHYVTKAQLDILQLELQKAIDGMSPIDQVEYSLYELLAKAAYENGRERVPKRQPRKSSKWVDFY
ncbi:hypothetical protein CYMTET_23808 [Cymbomonas tetramitiformis]|uniref:4Fe-4S ferredoxin-type domain-containing protein n=1 Tax=Cymbomonas tetramitiformis TaxID=36881 RepID=A0AAE0L0W9_9CHLO|nr:hypothetical protein CYMTET_23808 [Cymbomonas tetramitiformis]